MKCSSKFCKNPAAENRKTCQPCLDRQREYDKSRVRSPEYRANARKKRLDHFDMAVNHYGGACVRCGDSESIHLIFHHKNGDGFKDRPNRVGPSASTLLWKWKKDGYPEDLELLCANCHLAHHRMEGFRIGQKTGFKDSIS